MNMHKPGSAEIKELPLPEIGTDKVIVYPNEYP